MRVVFVNGSFFIFWKVKFFCELGNCFFGNSSYMKDVKYIIYFGEIVLLFINIIEKVFLVYGIVFVVFG